MIRKTKKGYGVFSSKGKKLGKDKEKKKEQTLVQTSRGQVLNML